MAAGWLLVGAGYLCTDALYLFPALRFPPEVSDTLGLSYHDFRRPVRVICRSGEEGGTSPSVTDDPCVARELLLEVCRSIGQPLPWNRPPEPPADAGGRFYTLEMHCRSQTVLTVQLQEDWPYILVTAPTTNSPWKCWNAGKRPSPPPFRRPLNSRPPKRSPFGGRLNILPQSEISFNCTSRPVPV